jgi:hypothetical protein
MGTASIIKTYTRLHLSTLGDIVRKPRCNLMIPELVSFSSVLP